MQNKIDRSTPFPKDFFKQFRSKESFQEYFKQGIEEMLKCELDEYLGYSKHAKDGYNTGNSRNGSWETQFLY